MIQELFMVFGDFWKWAQPSRPNVFRAPRRMLALERLDARSLMAADLSHNFLFPEDVNDDRAVTPSDALRVINRLNDPNGTSASDRSFHDVNDDSSLTPLDALIVLNQLNLAAAQLDSPPEVSTFAQNLDRGVRVRFDIENEGEQIEWKVRLDGAPANQEFEVTLNDIVVGTMTTDLRGRGKLVLSRGDDNREHLPLPESLLPYDPSLELIIGDLFSGTLTARDDRGTDSPNPNPTKTSEETLIAIFPTSIAGIRSAQWEQEFEDGKVKRSLEVEVEGLPAGTIEAIKIAGVEVGRITIDGKGKGKLRYSSFPKDSRESPFPENFPQVSQGTSIEIGVAKASFQFFAPTTTA